MDHKTLKIKFQPTEEWINETKERMKDAIEHGIPYIQPKNLMIWSSPENYQKFMSDQKYAILAAIHKHHPPSIYRLAQILNRAQQNVARDCESLAANRFIRFSKATKTRTIKTPRLAFDYDSIEVILPTVSYQITFEKAA